MQPNSLKNIIKQLDLVTTFIPFFIILILCALFVMFPTNSAHTLESIRSFLGNELCSYYLLIGLFMFLCSFYLAFSRFGKIKLGTCEAPEYSNFKWGSMMFTSGLAADILFYSFCEWMLYASEDHIMNLGGMQTWASTYAIFHWGPIPWSFYLVLSISFGFMLHVRKRNKQKFSEACRPLLGKHTDGFCGKLIDMLAIFALLAGTATTFSLATPLLSLSISRVSGIPQSTTLTLVILLLVCCFYTVSVYFGMKGIVRSATICMYLFFILLGYIFLFGGETRYIVETGIASIGNLIQNFIPMATYTDPLRTTSFAQNWTIFYWAYWMVWCVAAPFFIGSISKGRTIRQVILGGYLFGLSSTFTSFIILGNYGLGLQMHGRLDLLEIYANTGDVYTTILAMLEQLPASTLVLILLIFCMVTFYSTSFDSITLVASSYSYKELSQADGPDRRVKLFWAIFLILLPLALIFSENSMANLQTVSIIAAFPLGMIMILMVGSFFKDAKNYLVEQQEPGK